MKPSQKAGGERKLVEKEGWWRKEGWLRRASGYGVEEVYLAEANRSFSLSLAKTSMEDI